MKSNYELALEVIAGKWSSGRERKIMLENEGYCYEDVQTIVNAILDGSYYDKTTEIVNGEMCVEIDLTKVEKLTLVFKE